MTIQILMELIQDTTVSEENFVKVINSINHFEIARLLHQFAPDEKTYIFKALQGDKKWQELLYETDEDSRQEIIASWSRFFLARFLSAMPEDEATDIIKELALDIQEDILARMGSRNAGIIKNLIHHSEETAGSLMVPSYNRILPHQQAGQILLSLKKESSQDYPPYFYVINEQNELLGFFELHDLLNVSPITHATQLMRKKNVKVLYSTILVKRWLN